ncbi:hypothetical protein F5Y14DRAFT_426994 [Nemania sp. NC0429]|nr:hypothetical protein F5Y14DRAFT_426994 [Nemania sp. NC0429]
MQTLWSSAARAQFSCRRRVCLHSPNALTRWSTWAVPRRKPSFGDLFTACYTTILGTAAIIDARRKEERRRILDQELDRARAALNQVTARRPQGSRDGENAASDEETAPPKRLPTYLTSRAGTEAVRPLLRKLQSLTGMTHRPLARQSWIKDQIDWAHIETCVAIEEQALDVVLQEPLSHAQLTDTTLLVLDLVDELLRRARTYPSGRPQDKRWTSTSAGDRILEELGHLRYGHDFPSYQFPSADPVYTAQVRLLLNDHIRRIFNRAVPSRETVGRICYNLITAGVPPSVHTYNTLIAGFNRIQRPDLAQAVVNSYLDQARWPATDQTIVCLLNHYRGPGGLEGMREVVQRMRGVMDGELRLATIDKTTNARRCRRVERNDATFDHLIRGWLYHGEIGIACMTFVACLRAGPPLPHRTLQELLRGVLATGSFANARKLLVGIIRNFDNFKSYLSGIIQNNRTRVVRDLLWSLQQIINICWLPFGEIFGQSHQTYAAAVASLKSVLGRLDVQQEVWELARLPIQLSSALNSSKPLLARLELAIATLDATELSRRTSRVSEKAYTRIAMLVSIERRSIDLEEKTQNITAALKAVIISIKSGYEVFWILQLLSNPLSSRAFEDRRGALRVALNQVDVYDECLSIEKVTNQLFCQIPNQDLIRQLEENGNRERLSFGTLVYFFGRDMVAPRAYEEPTVDHAHEQLESRVRAAHDSIRALIFTHIPYLQQRQAMYYYRGYYRIPIRRLFGYLHETLARGLPRVSPMISPYYEDTIYHTSESLPRPGPEGASLSNRSTSWTTNDSASYVREVFKEAWKGAAELEKLQALSLLREANEEDRFAQPALYG